MLTISDAEYIPEEASCAIHVTDATKNLCKLTSIDTWRVILAAAKVRKYDPIYTLIESEMPQLYYHRKCYQMFTIKSDLMLI